MPVRMFKPKTLPEAYSLARLQEITVAALQNKPKTHIRTPQVATSSSTVQNTPKHTNLTHTSSSNPFRKLTKTGNSPPPNSFNRNTNSLNRNTKTYTNRDFDERRAKGLCFWCPEKYFPGHVCKQKRVYEIRLCVDAEEEGSEYEEEEEEAEVAKEEEGVGIREMQVSLNAASGCSNPKTMRLTGTCGKRRLHVLIDSGSTHNFVNEQLMSKLNYVLQPVEGVRVTVANGQVLDCTSYCQNFNWVMQGQRFQTGVYVILLENYDLILGAQWLSTLGDILWNFQRLSMKFQLNGVQHELHGEGEGGLKWIEGGQLPKLLHKTPELASLQLVVQSIKQDQF